MTEIKWIPITEETYPWVRGKLLVTTRWGEVTVDEWMERQMCWRGYFDEDIIAWAELPEAYKG